MLVKEVEEKLNFCVWFSLSYHNIKEMHLPLSTCCPLTAASHMSKRWILFASSSSSQSYNSVQLPKLMFSNILGGLAVCRGSSKSLPRKSPWSSLVATSKPPYSLLTLQFTRFGLNDTALEAVGRPAAFGRLLHPELRCNVLENRLFKYRMENVPIHQIFTKT